MTFSRIKKRLSVMSVWGQNSSNSTLQNGKSKKYASYKRTTSNNEFGIYLQNLVKLVNENKKEEIKKLLYEVKEKFYEKYIDDISVYQLFNRKVEDFQSGKTQENNFYTYQLPAFLENPYGHEVPWFLTKEKYVQKAMSIAIAQKHNDILQIFLELGVSADCLVCEDNAPSVNGNMRMLDVAIAKNNNEAIELLIKHGASARSRYLEAAILKENIKLTTFCLINKINPHEVIFQGKVAINYLGLAVERQNVPIMKALLHYGASIQITLKLLRDKYQDNLSQYRVFAQQLMDFASGYHFQNKEAFIDLFIGISLEQFNFIGVMVDSELVTLKLLNELDMKNADTAFFRPEDLLLVNNDRTDQISITVGELQAKFGKKFYDISNQIRFRTLSVAAEGGYVDDVKALLSTGTHPHESELNLYNQVEKFRHPLLLAAKSGHQDIVKCLLEKGCQEKLIRRALEIVLLKEDFAMADILLEYYAVNQQSLPNKKTLLHFICEQPHATVAMVEYLQKKGADYRVSEMGRGPLHYAARAFNVELTDFFIKQKVEIYADKKNHTPDLLALKRLSDVIKLTYSDKNTREEDAFQRCEQVVHLLSSVKKSNSFFDPDKDRSRKYEVTHAHHACKK